MLRRLLFVVLALYSITYNAYSMTALEQKKDMDVKKAFSVLKETDIVSSKIVNDDAAKSRNCWAFTKLLDSKNNIELFKELFKDSKYVSGKIYALIALYKLEPKSYQILKEEIKEPEIVEQGGCIVFHIPTKKLFADIEKGGYSDYYYFEKLPEYESTAVTYDKNLPPKELCYRKSEIDMERYLKEKKEREEELRLEDERQKAEEVNPHYLKEVYTREELSKKLSLGMSKQAVINIFGIPHYDHRGLFVYELSRDEILKKHQIQKTKKDKLYIVGLWLEFNYEKKLTSWGVIEKNCDLDVDYPFTTPNIKIED